jgi:hypothetical protein
MPLFPLPPIGRLSPAASRLLLDQTVAVSVLAAALGGGLLLLPAARRQADPEAPAARALAWLPFAGLLFIAALLICNQVLVGVHIQVAYHGDPAPITRYLGPGWFELPRSGPLSDLIARLARDLPPSLSGREGLLSYTLLRVQAVLELPFTLCAYLSVCGLVAPCLVPALVRGPLFPAAALSFTFTFCLIEARLWNPYTVSDIRARGLCCAAVLLLWPILRRAVPPASLIPLHPRPGGAALLLGYAGAGAVCVLVLGLYDATLLYNLGHLPRYLPVLCAAVAVAALSLALSRQLQPRAPSPAVQTVASLLCAFAVLFFVPSLAIRYCGARPSAALGGLAVAALALLAGLLLAVRGLRAQGRSFALALPGLIAFACVGGALGYAAFYGRLGLGFVSGVPILEARLLLSAAFTLIPGTVAAWAVDAVVTAVARSLRRDPAGAAAPPPPPRAAR